jgi:hypothetical protein
MIFCKGIFWVESLESDESRILRGKAERLFHFVKLINAADAVVNSLFAVGFVPFNESGGKNCITAGAGDLNFVRHFFLYFGVIPY